MTKARDIAEFPKSLNIGEKTNLLTNGDFTTDTSNWTATTATLSINSSRLQIIPDASVNGFATQQVDNLVVGRSYIASVDIIQDASQFGRIYIGTTLNGQETASISNLGVGSHSCTFTATATTHYFALVVGGGTQQTTIFDNARLTEANTITFPAISGTSPSIRQGTTVNDLTIATNNINRLNVDSSGRVTMPSQPMFHAWCTDGGNGAVSAGSSPTSFYASLNVGSHFSSGTFTAPIAGKYRFYASILTGAANGGYGLYQFTVNNSGSFGGGINTNWGQGYNYATANDKAITRELIVDLAANDYVKLQVNNTNTNLYWAGGYSYFGGHLIG